MLKQISLSLMLIARAISDAARVALAIAQEKF